MVSKLILILSSASGDVGKDEKSVKFGVILGNRFSSAAAWTDRDGLKSNGKLNVPAKTY